MCYYFIILYFILHYIALESIRLHHLHSTSFERIGDGFIVSRRPPHSGPRRPKIRPKSSGPLLRRAVLDLNEDLWTSVNSNGASRQPQKSISSSLRASGTSITTTSSVDLQSTQGTGGGDQLPPMSSSAAAAAATEAAEMDNDILDLLRINIRDGSRASSSASNSSSVIAVVAGQKRVSPSPRSPTTSSSARTQCDAAAKLSSFTSGRESSSFGGIGCRVPGSTGRPSPRTAVSLNNVDLWEADDGDIESGDSDGSYRKSGRRAQDCGGRFNPRQTIEVSHFRRCITSFAGPTSCKRNRRDDVIGRAMTSPYTRRPLCYDDDDDDDDDAEPKFISRHINDDAVVRKPFLKSIFAGTGTTGPEDKVVPHRNRRLDDMSPVCSAVRLNTRWKLPIFERIPSKIAGDDSSAATRSERSVASSSPTYTTMAPESEAWTATMRLPSINGSGEKTTSSQTDKVPYCDMTRHDEMMTSINDLTKNILSSQQSNRGGRLSPSNDGSVPGTGGTVRQSVQKENN